MNESSDFWNVLAPFHSEIEDSNFDLVNVRRLLPEIELPVLVVGAGQGLIGFTLGVGVTCIAFLIACGI